MDLNTLDIPETTELKLTGPTGEPLIGENGDQAVIVVRGPHHSAAVGYKKLVTARVRKSMSKGKGNIYDAIDDNMEVDRLHAHTDSVSGLEMNGEPLTRDGMREIYSNPKFSWLTDQVSEKLRSWEDFLS